MSMKRKWNIVHDCDCEDGSPTQWALKVGETDFYWIDLLQDNTYDVVNPSGTVMVNCKSLKSAKAWVTRRLQRNGLK